MSATNKIADTSFSAGVNDKLAVADKLTTKTGIKINSIQEASHKAGEVLANLIKGITGDAGDILKEVQGKIKVDSSGLMARVFANDGSIKSAFASLPSISKENIASKLNANDELLTRVNNITSVVEAADFDRINGLNNIGKKLTSDGFLNLSDTKSLTSLISGLVKEANQLGIKGSVNSFIGGLTGDSKNSIVAEILKTSLPDLIKYGDTESIQGLIGVTVSKSLSGIRPDIAKQIAKAFKLKLKPDGSIDVYGSYTSLIQLLDLTNPGWNTFIRQDGGDEGYRLSKILFGNKEHIRTFQEGGRKNGTGIHKLHAIVGSVKARSVSDDIRKHFSSVMPETSTVLKKNSSGNIRRDRSKDPIVTSTLVGLGLLNVVLSDID